MISLIPSLQLPGVRVAESTGPVVTGVPTIEMVAPTMVSILVYHVSVVAVMLGSENLTPVAVCSSAQNGSVPRATNGVNRVAVETGGATTPVATMIGDAGAIGTTEVDWNGLVQLASNPRERRAMMVRDLCIGVW
jgi:hypothetical protein